MSALRRRAALADEQNGALLLAARERAKPALARYRAVTARDPSRGAEVGTATLYLEGKALAYYYYAFYDLNYYARNLGMSGQNHHRRLPWWLTR